MDAVVADERPEPEAFEADACQIRYLRGFNPDIHLGALVYPEAIRMLNHE